jgi:hypothetical protein
MVEFVLQIFTMLRIVITTCFQAASVITQDNKCNQVLIKANFIGAKGDKALCHVKPRQRETTRTVHRCCAILADWQKKSRLLSVRD